MTARLRGAVLATTALATAGWLAFALSALAASPAPTAGSGGDPRSSGQGPGLVGDPLFAVLAVFTIGVAALGLTLLYVRLTDRRRT